MSAALERNTAIESLPIEIACLLVSPRVIIQGVTQLQRVFL